MTIRKENRIKIVSGHYGVGKSEFASNLALKMSNVKNSNKKIVIVDLDIVNPYFTTRGIKDYLKKFNIEIVGPSSEATNADLPAIPREVESVFYDENYEVIVDLGGDSAGSKVLGRYNNILTNLGYDFYYLINVNRPFSEDLDGVYQFLLDIQNATRLKITHLINSTHLLYETTLEEIKKGDEICKELSKKLSIPYKYVVIPEWIINSNNKINKKTNLDKNSNNIDKDNKSVILSQKEIDLSEKIKNYFNAEDYFVLKITLRPVWLSDENL